MWCRDFLRKRDCRNSEREAGRQQTESNRNSKTPRWGEFTGYPSTRRKFKTRDEVLREKEDEPSSLINLKTHTGSRLKLTCEAHNMTLSSMCSKTNTEDYDGRCKLYVTTGQSDLGMRPILISRATGRRGYLDKAVYQIIPTVRSIQASGHAPFITTTITWNDNQGRKGNGQFAHSISTRTQE